MPIQIRNPFTRVNKQQETTPPAESAYYNTLEKTWSEYQLGQKYIESGLNFKMDAPPVAIHDKSGWFYSYYSNFEGNASCQTFLGQANAYMYCPVVNAIVNKKIQARRNARYSIIDKDHNDVNPLKLGQAGKLFLSPNPMFNWKEFQSIAYAHQQVFGQSITNPVYPVGMEKIDYAQALWTLPPWFYLEIPTYKLFLQTEMKDIIKSVNLIGGFADVLEKINPDNLLRIRDIGIWLTARVDRQWWGQSRLYPHSQVVNNIMKAYEARYTLMENRGGIGILSTDEADPSVNATPLGKREKERVENAFFENHGIGSGQRPVIVSAARWKWQAMTFPTKDLLLAEEIADGARALYEAYGVSFSISPYDQRSNSLTPASQGDALREMYTDTIIPETESDMELWSGFLGFTAKGLMIKADFSHLPIFQKSQLDSAKAAYYMGQFYTSLFTNKLCTAEEVRGQLPEIDEMNDWEEAIPAGTMFTGPAAKDLQPPAGEPVNEPQK